ncbi:MAG: efflux RND transporter permease subunit [Candidatus Sumerlaeota bacterium]|nr:efflux RND transporter permease subunit [Candidatus Sumerlaeota bacterium]
MSFHDFPIRSPVKVLMLFLGILLLGWISLNRLTISLFPDLRSPKITVVIRTEGLSPEEIERTIIEWLERRLITIRHVADLVAIARADTAIATVIFDWGANMDFALLDVKKAVGDISQRDDVKEVTTLQYDPNALPIYTLALSGAADPAGGAGAADQEALLRLAVDVFKPDLERMEGVAAANVTGGREKEVAVQVDENLLLHYRIDLPAVEAALRASMMESSGGYVTSGNERLLLKMVGQRNDLDAIGATVVGYTGDVPIYLRDVARIEIRDKDPESLVRIDGQPGVGISLYKEVNANTVGVVQSVRKELDELKKGLPKGVKITPAYDQSVFLSTAIHQLVVNVIIGMGLAMLVLLAFLRNLRSTLIISLAIPVSVIATFTLMYFQGITVNMMSLGGLALGSGMLVDNAIVVLESIFMQRELGLDRRAAAVDGARQVGAAITASTLTTVVVFLPIVFVRGVAGMLFKEFAETVVYSLLASLAVALLLVPMLCSRFLKAAAPSGKPTRSAYERGLALALRHRLLVVVVAAVLVGASPFLLRRVPREFMPKAEEGQLVMRVHMPPGTRIEVTDQAVAQIERRVQQLPAAVAQTYSRIGVADVDASMQGEEVEGPHTAEMVLTLKDPKQGGMRASEVIDALRPDLAKIPDLTVEYVLQQGTLAEILSTGGAPIVVEIEGEELDQLAAAAQRARVALESVSQLHNVTTNVQQGNPEMRLRLDGALLAGLGFSVDGVAQALRSRLQGSVTSLFESPEGDLDIRLTSRQAREEGLERLGEIRLRSPLGREVTLGDLAAFEKARGQQEIVRRRQKRVVRIMADIRSGKLSDVVAQTQTALAGVALPPGYVARLSGEEEQRAQSFRQLAFAFALASILVYMVMAGVLESLIHPFTIMLTVPLASIGVALGFLITHETINLMAYIGVVVLVGIVVNNAIVLLDYVNQLRQGGMETREALLVGGRRRLRPILMTTLTTILALVPLILGIGEGARLQRPLAVAVFGGMVSTTILTLFVIPVVYSLLDDLGRFVRRSLGRKHA